MEQWPAIEVVGAVIVREGRVFLAQRPFRRGSLLSGLWEFPGGKVEPGESREEALVRELEEELGVILLESRYFTFSRTRQGGRFIELYLYWVEKYRGTLALREHAGGVWVHPVGLGGYPLAPGDVGPAGEIEALYRSGGF